MIYITTDSNKTYDFGWDDLLTELSINISDIEVTCSSYNDGETFSIDNDEITEIVAFDGDCYHGITVEDLETVIKAVEKQDNVMFDVALNVTLDNIYYNFANAIDFLTSNTIEEVSYKTIEYILLDIYGIDTTSLPCFITIDEDELINSWLEWENNFEYNNEYYTIY